MDTSLPVLSRLGLFVSGGRSMGLRVGRAVWGTAVMAGLEYAMQSRAKIGLFIVALLSAPLAAAHAPGVTHSYERGEPVITVRLVPEEAAVARDKRVNALEQPAPATDGAIQADPASAPGAAIGETADPVATSPGEFNGQLTPEPALEESADQSAATARYPNVRPVMKPNTETGVGGALDLAPPPSETASEPRPMRLNAVDRPRRVADRAARQRARDDNTPRTRRVQTEAAPAEPVVAAEPDPLDAALPPVVIDQEPASAMRLPQPKAEDRIIGSN